MLPVLSEAEIAADRSSVFLFFAHRELHEAKGPVSCTVQFTKQAPPPAIVPAYQCTIFGVVSAAASDGTERIINGLYIVLKTSF
jgi:hypothetical protein